ncbi:hypothetical protein MGG_00311 [Pyricularia oryzae 70-15]|uniref:Aspergillopepsin-2 n=3 Tax=Pyricularia oryzae TaxID=318829 RepID=G4ND02_PYRO7|nr:uncharacterized protein MGG_00311 [Pyricularia oryzae 70-15]EHA49192.1 hypothetical protein MGG_00311 [Pyricularia oryzae 70-15]ELQ37290.1 hypothetical protein OOU_Y34scaffold00608g57 [Pyricularia oryzae Y34]KAI7921311.1 hypothetical protein M9X92_005478 [Pyricularia oryzae]KAI7925775.1 hypothetical protein M0657_004090 [Pyricularia oryzae]
MRTFSLLVSLLLLVVSTSAIEIKVVSVTAEDGAKPIDPASIKLVPRPLSPSSIERVRNKTVEDGDPAHAGRRSATPANAVSYSGNWCGAMQNAPASNLVSSVSGWLTAPILDIRHTENRTPQFAASWMGIDGGENCRTALLQGGTTTEIDANGFQTSKAWFEWIPDAAYDIPNMPVAPGDNIHIEVEAITSRKGRITMTNADQPFSIVIELTDGQPLCRRHAEWIVENFRINSNRVPFAKFDDIWFQECEVKLQNGQTWGVDGSRMYYMETVYDVPVCRALEYDNGIFLAESDGN